MMTVHTDSTQATGRWPDDPSHPPAGAIAWMYASPLDDGGWITDPDYADEVRRSDPNLLVPVAEMLGRAVADAPVPVPAPAPALRAGQRRALWRYEHATARAERARQAYLAAVDARSEHLRALIASGLSERQLARLTGLSRRRAVALAQQGLRRAEG